MHIQGNRLHCLKASETLLNLAAWILYNYGRVISFSVNMLTLNFNQSLRLSFHCGQYYLINPYGISVSQMITDVFPDVVITRVIRWVPLMDQEQVTRNTRVHPWSFVGFVLHNLFYGVYL